MSAFGGIFVESDDAMFTAELAAARCLHHCCGGADHAHLPIPIEEWAERELRYDIEYQDIEPDGDREVLGFSEPGNNRIVLNARHSGDLLRLRFTLAHEIGHHTLNHYTALDPDSRLAMSEPSDHATRPLELQADRFARALLMPPALVHTFFLQAVSEEGLSDDEVMTVLGDDRRGMPVWRDVLLPRACALFHVSAPAVLVRFLELTLSRSHESLLPRSQFERMLQP